MTTRNKAMAALEKHADEVRQALGANEQQALFEAAIEAAYLAGVADGTLDDEERDALVSAIEVLSSAHVIEWETTDLIDACAARTEEEGADARAEATGERLKSLGQPEGGLLVAAIVACATGGVDRSESRALKAVGAAAGLDARKTGAITKRAKTFFSS